MKPPSFSHLDEINSLFRHIDSVQSQVFQQIKFISTNGLSDQKNPPETFSRDATVKAANTLIQKIPDLVRVVELKASQLPSDVAAASFLHETIELYNGKVKHLRRKLKDAQLAAYEEENLLVHQQRLQEYCGQKNDDSSANSVDAVDARQSLFSGRTSSEKNPHDKTKSIGDQILTQNKNITTSLQHSKQLMTMSVMQTELNIDTLGQQSKDLTQLNEKLIDMESVLTKSKQIVKFIEKQDKRDKRRIYAAIGFLLLCSAWVLWRRVLKMPVRILLWSLFKMFGVVSWATTVTPRGNTPGESPGGYSGGISASSSPSFAATSSVVNTAIFSQKEVESIPDEAFSSSSTPLGSSLETFSGETSEIETLSTSSLEETTTTSTVTETTQFSEIFVQDIGSESSILTWEGSLSSSTETPEISLISDDEEGENFDENRVEIVENIGAAESGATEVESPEMEHTYEEVVDITEDPQLEFHPEDSAVAPEAEITEPEIENFESFETFENFETSFETEQPQQSDPALESKVEDHKAEQSLENTGIESPEEPANGIDEVAYENPEDASNDDVSIPENIEIDATTESVLSHTIEQSESIDLSHETGHIEENHTQSYVEVDSPALEEVEVSHDFEEVEPYEDLLRHEEPTHEVLPQHDEL